MTKSFLKQVKSAVERMNEEGHDYKETLKYALEQQRKTSKFVDELRKKEQLQFDEDELKK